MKLETSSHFAFTDSVAVASLQRSYAIPYHTDSEANWHLAREWVTTCDRSHSCRQASAALPWYPTRLLDVSNGSIRLVITQESKPSGLYATLSHCWGTARFLQLNAKTIRVLKGGFLSEDLPKTFQHAVHATRMLGLQYLWIDSLCIIQGVDLEAKADWQFEAARMEDVYKNSYCNSGSPSFLLAQYIRTAEVPERASDGMGRNYFLSPKDFRRMSTDFTTKLRLLRRQTVLMDASLIVAQKYGSSKSFCLLPDYAP